MKVQATDYREILIVPETQFEEEFLCNVVHLGCTGHFKAFIKTGINAEIMGLKMIQIVGPKAAK